MCGRLVRERDEYAEQYGFAEFSETRVVPRFNVGPMQLDLLVRPEPEGDARELAQSWWGLVPSWAKDPKVGSRAFNARTETLMERPTFRGLVARRRGVIPASGFYEWKRDGARKQPYFIHRGDGAPIAFAALWDTWTDPVSGERRVSHTVITTTPNDLMAGIHDRMPVILDGEALDIWLDRSVADPAAVLPLLQPFRDGELSAYPVDARVGNIRFDDPDLIAPLDPADTPS